jgi:hypothetical protein
VTRNVGTKAHSAKGEAETENSGEALSPVSLKHTQACAMFLSPVG